MASLGDVCTLVLAEIITFSFLKLTAPAYVDGDAVCLVGAEVYTVPVEPFVTFITVAAKISK